MEMSQKLKSIDTRDNFSHLEKLGWTTFFQQQLEGVKRQGFPARVTGVRKYSFIVRRGGQEELVSLAGRLVYEEGSHPAVGDWVMVRGDMITEVLPRKNGLTRKSAGGRNLKKGTTTHDKQVMAANLDGVFIVCGLDRDFNLRRIERYLTLVYDCGITPVIILTKADLHQNPEECLQAVEDIAFGVDVCLVSAADENSINAVYDLLEPGHTAALIGSSGAGKSTLINRLYGEEIRETSSVSETQGKGRHTTTTRDLVVLPSGGLIIDNPGLREVGLADPADGSVTPFPEIEEYGRQCKFADCSHTHEPGCRVLEAVSTGDLEMARLQNYMKIKDEHSYLVLRETKGAARMEKERWREVSRKSKAIRKTRNRS